jgi:hypothetical protein
MTHALCYLNSTNRGDAISSGAPDLTRHAVKNGAGTAMKVRGGFRIRPLTRAVARCLASIALSVLAVGLAHACTCETISPAQGFERAEYVFAGKVVETAGHTWTIDVDLVWKGSEKLAARVRLLDVYAGIDGASYFEQGRSYLFFAIVAKSSRYVYYQSQVCNWTSTLHSRRVHGRDGSVWLEEFIVENYGPGEPPKGEDPWRRRSARALPVPAPLHAPVAQLDRTPD